MLGTVLLVVHLLAMVAPFAVVPLVSLATKPPVAKVLDRSLDGV